MLHTITGTELDFNPQRLTDFVASHRIYAGNPGFELESAHREFVGKHYGARLSNAVVETRLGREVVDWTINFEDTQTLRTRRPSWRPGSIDRHLDYSYHYLESSLANWDANPTLIPVAAISSDEMAEFDLLCLDYSTTPARLIVYRIHEMPDQKLEAVADSLTDWLAKAEGATDT